MENEKITIANPIYDSVFKRMIADEYYSAIENRDTALMARDKKIKEQDIRLIEQGNKIAEQNAKISAMSSALSQTIIQLYAKGLSVEEMSKMTGMCIEDINEILKL